MSDPFATEPMPDFWHAITVMVPDYADVEAVLEVLRQRGFVENDCCALNRREDGATVSWGPMEHPGQRPYKWEVLC